jgi:tetratricopeptide (TPR) repeat protein/DNA-binding XRE family transcriptional regulator
MQREHFLARVLRALSGKSQARTAAEIGVHRSLVSQVEDGRVFPRPAYLARLAATGSVGVEEAAEILSLAGERQRARQAQGARPLGLARLGEAIAVHVASAERRLAALAASKDHQPARFRQLVVRTCLALCDESERAASRNVEEAAVLGEAARDLADRVPGPEGLRDRLAGRAAAHQANVLRVAGSLREADSLMAQAKRLWDAGCDPDGLLDPGRMLDLEASLRRAQRRFAEALACLDEAVRVGKAPARALIIKAFTLEAMGEHERAVEALREAEASLDREAEPQLWYHQRLQLAVVYTHLRRCGEAAALVEEAAPVAADLGDGIVLLRVTWLRGRIAAGLGRSGEALELLAQARAGFAARGMTYDVALALLEEAVLLLDEGRSAAVRELARELAAVFESKGVHREALAALRLFHDAAERDQATAELARRVLGFLFRAQHDRELRFGGRC